MGHTSVTCVSKRWRTAATILVISCMFHVSMSHSDSGSHLDWTTNRRNQETYASTEEFSQHDDNKRLMFVEEMPDPMPERSLIEPPSTVVEQEVGKRGYQSHENQTVTPGHCSLNQTVMAIHTELQNQGLATDSDYKFIIVSPDQDDSDERSALYHFSLNDLSSDDNITNATVFTPFSMTTGSQTVNITITIRVRRNGTERQSQETTVHHPNASRTTVCLQRTVTQVVQQLLDSDSYNLTFDVGTSCQFRSSALGTTNCSVDHLGRPFLVVFYQTKSEPRSDDRSLSSQSVIPELCHFHDVKNAIEDEERKKNASSADGNRIWNFKIPFQTTIATLRSFDGKEETSTFYYFSLDRLTSNDTIINTTIFHPFILIGSGISSPILNVTNSVRMTDSNGPHSQILLTNVYRPAPGKTEFCHQITLTKVVRQMAKAGLDNLMITMSISCHDGSGTAGNTNCSVDQPDTPFIAIYRLRSTTEPLPQLTTERPTFEPTRVSIPSLQTVNPGLCSRNETAFAIHNWLESTNRSSDSSIRWIFVASDQDVPELSTLYHFDLNTLTNNDTILNATVYTPFSIAMSGNPTLSSFNVTISVRMTEADGTQSQVQFTNVYNFTTDKTKFCHLGTLTQVVQQMLGTDNRNLTVDVSTSCQFGSIAQQGPDCSVDHPGGPFLAINYRTTTNTFPWNKIWLEVTVPN